ncbi:Sulfatase, partial [hydrothermal vent metagenome]
HDWAQYYDRITEMDTKVGQNLKELENAGLTEETIIFYYGDHGSGMPRSKRSPYNSWLQVPLVIYIPPKFRHLMPKDYKTNGKTNRLAGFVDFAPTLLSLAGIKPPKHMQGNAFMGKYEAKPQQYQFGFRGRMDERYDMVRSVRNKRYIYIRNFMPHKIYGQYLDYMFKTPTTRVWKKLYDEGKLKPPQTYFWETKPSEELYDLHHDPDEVRNLANSKEHQKIRDELNKALQKHILSIRDIGLLSEAETYVRSKNMTPYEMGQNPQLYDIENILKMALFASSGKPTGQTKLIKGLSNKDSAIRYWAAMGILMRGKPAVMASRKELHRALNDSSKSVRCIAAEALGKYGTPADVTASVNELIKLSDLNEQGLYVAMLALNSLDQLGNKTRPIRDQIAKLPQHNKSVNRRMRSYINRLVVHILSKLDAKQKSP